MHVKHVYVYCTSVWGWLCDILVLFAYSYCTHKTYYYVEGISPLVKVLHALQPFHCFCLRLRANGCNIVDQQHPTLLDVTCCICLHTLLHVVACCCAFKFETGQIFQPTTPNISFVPWSPKLSATMLDPFAQLFQHCWGRACLLRMVY